MAQFIDDAYVYGLSITHGINPRHHIWTYAAGHSENGTHDDNCSCHIGSNKTKPYYAGEVYSLCSTRNDNSRKGATIS